MKSIDSVQSPKMLAKIGVIAGIVLPLPGVAQTSSWVAESVCPDNTPAVFHACAQEAAAFDPPRTPEGRPDMTGIWHLPGAWGGGAYEDLEEHPRQLDDRGGPAAIVDPPDGTVPMQAWAEERRQGHTQQYVHPSAACFLPGVPHSTYNGEIRQFIQTPDYLVIQGVRTHEYRIIYLDERPPIGEDIRLWNGDSRGRWEGDTLVVETTNLDDRSWLDQRGRFFTEEAHVVERLTFIDANTIHHEATLRDPNVYTRPFTIASPYRRNAQERFEMESAVEVCYENNEGLLEIYRDIGFELYPGIGVEEARREMEAGQ